MSTNFTKNISTRQKKLNKLLRDTGKLTSKEYNTTDRFVARQIERVVDYYSDKSGCLIRYHIRLYDKITKKSMSFWTTDRNCAPLLALTVTRAYDTFTKSVAINNCGVYSDCSKIKLNPEEYTDIDVNLDFN